MTKKKSLVFFDVSVDGDPTERMTFELFTDVAPKTAENFRALCTGEKGISTKTGKPLHYKGTFFHRITKGNVAQGGEFLRQNGNYGESIYDVQYPGCDESPKLKHDGPGLLSMTIGDWDERGSIFTVTFKANHHLDRRCVVFGKLVNGFEVLKKIENAGDENGRPAVTVKIINSGELNGDEDKGNKMGLKDENNHELKRKGKHKKSSKKRRKRRYYYTSESDTSTDSDTESSESDSDSDATSLSDSSSSSDDRRKKRKRSRRDRHRHGKRKDRRRDKQRKRRDRKSKRKSKRSNISDDENDSADAEDDGAAIALNGKHKNSEQGARAIDHKERNTADVSEREEGEYPLETGVRQSNGNRVRMESDRSASRCPDVVDHLTSKSRSRISSPKRAMSKSMSISPRIVARSPAIVQKRNRSRSPCPSRSPPQISDRSNTSARRGLSTSPVISPPRSKKRRSISRSPQHSHSRSPTVSSPRRSVTRSPPRTTSRRSPLRLASRSPVRSSRRSLSRSSGRPYRKSISRSPVRYSHRGVIRSSGFAPSRSPSRSPVRPPVRTSRRRYSRSPVSAGRRARLPGSYHGRSLSRSPIDGSPKRIRKGRGFSDRFLYARRYKSRSPDRSPVRSYRYGGRNDRDRYSSYRRYRSPPRERTPRYTGRRSRTRSPSVSRSPVRNRNRRYSRSRSPICSRSPVRSRSPVERSHVSPRAERRRSPSRSRIHSATLSSRDSRSPKNVIKGNSRSPSISPPRKAGLVSYGDGSPDSVCD
ncbi:hypothetical protein OROGR_009284 [Orobanche gracilis]